MKTKIKSILFVNLKCAENYPMGVVYLADYTHKQRPDIEQTILDLSRVPAKAEIKTLITKISEADPGLVVFSWHNVYPQDPENKDDILSLALSFYNSPNVIKKSMTALANISSLNNYNGGIKRNLRLLGAVKKAFPAKKIVIGGPAVGTYINSIGDLIPEETIAVVGEGENLLIKLIDGKDISDERVGVKKNGKLFFGQKQAYFDLWNQSTPLDLDYLESIFPDIKYYMEERFQDHHKVGVPTKRGCPYKCVFCIYGLIDGFKVRYRQPDVVIDEVEALVKRYKVKKFRFSDSQFYPSRHSLPIVERTLDGLTRRRLGIRWTSCLRVENITPSLFDKLVESGLSELRLAVSSGSPKVIKELKTGLRLNGFFKACRLLADTEYDGTIHMDLSLNAPGETPKTVIDTIDAVEKAAAIFKPGQVKPSITFLSIRPRSKLAERAASMGHLSPKFNPLILTSSSVKETIYNPLPLGRPIGRAIAGAMKTSPDDVGWTVLRELKEIFS